MCVKKLFHQDDWVTYYVKPSTTYALDHHFALHSGLGLYFTNNQAVNNVREWRPFLGLSHATAFTDKWGLSSYFRAEERYFESIMNEAEARVCVYVYAVPTKQTRTTPFSLCINSPWIWKVLEAIQTQRPLHLPMTMKHASHWVQNGTWTK